MKNTFWKRERIEIMIALALFNYVFLGAEYLFDNMMAFQTDSSGVVLAQSYVLGISTMGFLLFGVFDENNDVFWDGSDIFSDDSPSLDIDTPEGMDDLPDNLS